MASPSTSGDNFFRLAKLLARLSPRVLRKLFKQEALSGPEKTIDEFLHNKQGSILSLQRRKILHQSQIDIIFPASGNTDIEAWDLTLLTCLLRNLFTLSVQEQDDLDTLRTAKNEIYSHTSNAEIDNIQFNHLWNAIEPATMSLAALLHDNAFYRVIQSDIQSTKTGPLTVGDRASVDVLRIWAESDRKLEQQLGVLVEHTTEQHRSTDRIERLSACLVYGGVDALRPVLRNYVHERGFASIDDFLEQFKDSIRSNLSAKMDIVFPDDGSPTDESKWDVGMYFIILSRICNISGSVETHLCKLHQQRQNLYSEKNSHTFNSAQFEMYFGQIQASLQAVMQAGDISQVKALEKKLESFKTTTGNEKTRVATTLLVDWHNSHKHMRRSILADIETELKAREQLREKPRSDFKTEEGRALRVNLVITGDSEEDESLVYGCMQALKTGLTTLTGQLAAFRDTLCQHGNRIIGVERSSVDIAIECVSPGGLLHVWNIYDSGQLADRFEAVLRELREETGREMALQITCNASDILHTLHLKSGGVPVTLGGAGAPNLFPGPEMTAHSIHVHAGQPQSTSETIGEEGRGKVFTAPVLIRKATQPEVCSVHKEPLTLYCKKHEEVICTKCVSELHRTCNVDTKTSASEEIQAANEIKLEKLRPQKTIELKDQILTKVATYKVREPDDKGECYITGCQFLPSGRLVMCDQINKKLKLLDTDTGLVTSIKLKGWPCDVAEVSATEVVVTLHFSAELQFVTVEPELKAARRIRVGRHGRLGHGVAYHDQTLYVVDWDSGGEIVVHVLSLNGELLRTLPIHVPLYPLWSEMVMLAVDRHGRIYMANKFEDAVTCNEQNGAPVYKYQDEGLSNPAGFFVDSSQNVYVCGKYSDNIQVITAEGVKARTMLTDRDGLHHPMSIAYRDGDRTLAVGQNGDDILVFRAVSSK